MGGVGFLMEKYFYLDESPLYKDKYVIRLNKEDLCFQKGFTGSFGVFPARLLGLSYVQYLRFCRDILGAELIGKNKKYVSVYFDRTDEVRQFIKLLNARAALAMNYHNFPFEYKEVGDKVERSSLKGEENGSNEGNA